MNERKRGTGLKIKLILFALLALFLGGLGFGLGTGFHFGGNGSNPQSLGLSGQTNTLQPGSHAAETAAPQSSVMPGYEIIVSEKDILYNGKPCPLQSLRETLLAEYSGTKGCVLVDRHAIKSVYDACKAILDDLNIPYVEK